MKGILLTGHAGKLIKIAAGVMNTHSRQADCRLEVLAAHAAMAGADRESVCGIMKSITTAEALGILEKRGLLKRVLGTVMEKIEENLVRRAGKDLEIAVIMFSPEYGILGTSGGTEVMLREIKKTDGCGNFTRRPDSVS